MAFDNFEDDKLRERVIHINRVAKVVKGGRRFSFSALTVVGNQDGIVGFGFGKAKEIPAAMQKAFKDGRKHLVRVPRVGTTIPHAIEGIYCSSKVRLIPAAPGTGIIAGGGVRAVCEAVGIRDVLAKSLGSNNHANVVKATLEALSKLRPREEIFRVRGIKMKPSKAEAAVEAVTA